MRLRISRAPGQSTRSRGPRSAGDANTGRHHRPPKCRRIRPRNSATWQTAESASYRPRRCSSVTCCSTTGLPSPSDQPRWLDHRERMVRTRANPDRRLSTASFRWPDPEIAGARCPWGRGRPQIESAPGSGGSPPKVDGGELLAALRPEDGESGVAVEEHVHADHVDGEQDVNQRGEDRGHPRVGRWPASQWRASLRSR